MDSLNERQTDSPLDASLYLAKHSAFFELVGWSLNFGASASFVFTTFAFWQIGNPVSALATLLRVAAWLAMVIAAIFLASTTRKIAEFEQRSPRLVGLVALNLGLVWASIFCWGLFQEQPARAIVPSWLFRIGQAVAACLLIASGSALLIRGSTYERARRLSYAAKERERSFATRSIALRDGHPNFAFLSFNYFIIGAAALILGGFAIFMELWTRDDLPRSLEVIVAGLLPLGGIALIWKVRKLCRFEESEPASIVKMATGLAAFAVCVTGVGAIVGWIRSVDSYLFIGAVVNVLAAIILIFGVAAHLATRKRYLEARRVFRAAADKFGTAGENADRLADVPCETITRDFRARYPKSDPRAE